MRHEVLLFLCDMATAVNRSTSQYGHVRLTLSRCRQGYDMAIDEGFVAPNYPKEIQWDKEYHIYHYDFLLAESIIRKAWWFAIKYIKNQINSLWHTRFLFLI